jgi:hypothetical protein
VQASTRNHFEKEAFSIIGEQAQLLAPPVIGR